MPPGKKMWLLLLLCYALAKAYPVLHAVYEVCLLFVSVLSLL